MNTDQVRPAMHCGSLDPQSLRNGFRTLSRPIDDNDNDVSHLLLNFLGPGMICCFLRSFSFISDSLFYRSGSNHVWVELVKLNSAFPKNVVDHS